jgi:hypothetical protein
MCIGAVGMRRASESEFLVYGSKTTNHIIEMYSAV